MATRRPFTREFKVEAVRMVTRGTGSLSEVARRLGVGADRLRKWKQAIGAEGGHEAGSASPGREGLSEGLSNASALQEEDRRLRAENERLRMERGISKSDGLLREGVAIPTREGWLYLAAVEDPYSRKIVGRSMSERIDSRLVVDALEMAVRRQLPGEGGEGLVAHSDRGVQYASAHYQRLLNRHGITCSMSRKGSCWDNAPRESLFAALKKELAHHGDHHTRAEARASLFEYIEVFYNRVRRHSALGYLSPTDFEMAA